VYTKLKYINENAYFVLKIGKEDYVRSPDNGVRTMAHQEMIKLKQYLSDDESATVMQFFKVDLNRQDRVLSLL
jgi:hypothetical protein